MTRVRWQAGLEKRIHAILHRHVIVHGESVLFGTAGRRFLNLRVRTREEVALGSL